MQILNTLKNSDTLLMCPGATAQSLNTVYKIVHEGQIPKAGVALVWLPISCFYKVFILRMCASLNLSQLLWGSGSRDTEEIEIFIGSIYGLFGDLEMRKNAICFDIKNFTFKTHCHPSTSLFSFVPLKEDTNLSGTRNFQPQKFPRPLQMWMGRLRTKMEGWG